MNQYPRAPDPAVVYAARQGILQDAGGSTRDITWHGLRPAWPEELVNARVVRSISGNVARIRTIP